MVQRWTLHDPALDEVYVFAVNPNTMTTPHGPRALSVITTNPAPDQPAAMQGRVIEVAPDPYEWSFGGYLRTQDQHDQLLTWSRKVNQITLTDHLGRTWTIRMISFDPDEQRPTARRDWRFNYTIKAINYGLAS